MMPFPDDENGDVLRRMQQHGFDLTKAYPIEFFAVYATEEDADIVARQYLADHKTGDRLENIETRPHDVGGMELLLVKQMMPTHENITAFETLLAERTASVEGYLDGWGVLQE